MNDLSAFFTLINQLSGGGDLNQTVPESDTEDFRQGAQYIPGEVTLARRRGERVTFDPAAHQWTLPDGTKIPTGRSQHATTETP